jgi:hypothetical protein
MIIPGLQAFGSGNVEKALDGEVLHRTYCGGFTTT